ncbi:helix-turn-helix domain-containing protein [Nostoc sp.]|uniref:helix-turn-helix domain-containing protein n=1 Tax=Nostoc sp. TaxID=1180 RepID=UPI002FF936DB
MLRAVKVRLYLTTAQQAHLVQAYSYVSWVWNQSLCVMSQTYKKAGKGLSAYDMKKQILVWKVEYKWLKEFIPSVSSNPV